MCTDVFLDEMTCSPVGRGKVDGLSVIRSLVTRMWDPLPNSLYFCICLKLYIINFFFLK